MLLFAPRATDEGPFADYTSMAYPVMSEINVPTRIIGPELAQGPAPERPADIQKIWPAVEPIVRLRPDEFNPLLDRLAAEHCAGAST